MKIPDNIGETIAEIVATELTDPRTFYYMAILEVATKYGVSAVALWHDKHIPTERQFIEGDRKKTINWKHFLTQLETQAKLMRDGA